MFFRTHQNGWIEVIIGPMFSGKSSELLRRLDILQRAKEKIQVFSPKLDNRYGESNISNHNGWKWPAVDIVDSIELKKEIKDDTTVIVIDEIQFFDKGIIKTVEDFADIGIRVVVAGLAADFRGQPFEVTMNFIARAEFITKLEAVCVKCGGPATRVQRMTDGEPSSANEPTVVIDASDSYHPRCRHCHKVPDFDFNKAYND